MPGYSTERIYIYKAWSLSARAHIAEKDEVIKVSIFTKAGVKKLFKRGAITDAKTISALAFCGWL